jgi:hypothetical protein
VHFNYIIYKYKWEAERFYKSLIERLAKFGLEVAEEKTKIIMFGRFAEVDMNRQGLGKPETFDFLGFTHYCSKSQNGKYRIKSRTSSKKYRAKLKAFNEWIKKTRNRYKLRYIVDMVKLKLRGHYNYYGISDNSYMLNRYTKRVLRILYKWLNRRSQKKSMNKEKYNKYLKTVNLPKIKVFVNVGVSLKTR